MQKSVPESLKDIRKIFKNGLDECENLGVKIPPEIKKSFNLCINSLEDNIIKLTLLRNDTNEVL